VGYFDFTADSLYCHRTLYATEESKFSLGVREGSMLDAVVELAQQIRLVAGPGTGKSFSIEERVCWLLGQGIPPRAITVVSFTRASSIELRSRIHAYCAGQSFLNPDVEAIAL
jgi:hypothetical protein